MDSFELNKIVGAVLATCLGLLVVNIVAGAIFRPGKLEKPGYAIAVPDEPGVVDVAKPTVAEPLPTRLANSDPKRGEGVAKLCAACHTFEKGGPNRAGPNLYGIVGRAKASVPDFNYSAPLRTKGGTWTFDDLDHFIADPKRYLPGTSMAFSGLARERQRADLISYLRTLADNAVPLPEVGEAPASDSTAKIK